MKKSSGSHVEGCVRRKTLGLNARLFLVTTLGVVGTMLIVLTFSYRSFRKIIEQRFREKMEFVSRQLSSTAFLALAFRDKKALRRLAEAALREKEVVGLEIEDGLGEKLVVLGRTDPRLPRLVRKVVTRTAGEGVIFNPQAKVRERVLGRLTIYYTTAPVEELMKRHLLRSFLMGSFLALLIDLALYFLVSRAITFPLKELVSGVRMVQGGNLHFNPLKVSLPEVRELSEAFAEMVASLEASQRALAQSYEEMLRNKTLAEVGRFSLLIAHEIKNPLGIIKGALDILRKEEVDPELKAQMIAYIEEEVARINELVQNFLAFARPKKLKFAPLDLAQLLEAVGEKASLKNPAKKIHLHLERPLSFKGDAAWLERCFLNLVHNAFEAGAQGVWISAEVRQEEVVISFADDGPGIPKEKREEIFKPFYTEKIKGGAGLGLAIVEQIIGLHGGWIEVKESPYGGALFEIHLPITREKELASG